MSMMLPYAESADQNKSVILEVLREAFAASRRVLEIGAGTGQHAAHFSRCLPHVHWLPTERPGQLEPIELWRTKAGSANQESARALDAGRPGWRMADVDAAYTANTFHIMAWMQVAICIEGIGASLPYGGRFAVYGPFNYGGRFTSESNARFDEWLKRRDPLSGVRDFEAVCERAEAAGMTLWRDFEMPMNNRTLVFEKRAL